MNTIVNTSDGSNTVYNEAIGEHYHSKHGALQESKHVFINAGLSFAVENRNEISVLEIGFGTGLNFILSMEFCEGAHKTLHFTSLEAYPLTTEFISETNYQNYVPAEVWDNFIINYKSALSEKIEITKKTTLTVLPIKLQDFETDQKFDLIYYDAFSVQHQPEMWTDEIIGKVCNFLKPGGVFVTYAITGNLKRALKSNGFRIEKLPGAPGKREMLRGTKLTG